MLLIVLITGWMTFHGLVIVRYHGDEGSYLNDSIWFDQWLHLNFSSLSVVDEQKLLDAPVGPLLAGLSRHLARIDMPGQFTWAFNLPSQQAIPKSIYPSAAILFAGRLPMALLTFGTIVLVAALLLNQLGYMASASVTGFILFNPGVMDTLRQVMTESPLLFFSIVGLIFCARGISLLSKPRYQRRALTFLIAAGISVGLSTASKHNGVAALVACFLMVTLALITERTEMRTSRRRRAYHIISRMVAVCTLITLAATTTFVALNPFAWSNLPQSLGAIIAKREQLSVSHQQTWPEDALTTISARISTGIWRIFTEDSTMGCDPRLNGLIIMDVESNTFNWQENSSKAILSDSILCTSSLPWTYKVRPITILNLVLFLLGIVMLIKRQTKARGTRVHMLPTTTLLVWGIAVNLPIVALSPMNWSRYYILPVIFVSLLIAIGLSSLIRLFIEPMRTLPFVRH
jgi:4-amino-4-deoxy-L-arabinose transferase-like glycosyltransferase